MIPGRAACLRQPRKTASVQPRDIFIADPHFDASKITGFGPVADVGRPELGADAVALVPAWPARRAVYAECLNGGQNDSQ